MAFKETKSSEALVDYLNDLLSEYNNPLPFDSTYLVTTEIEKIDLKELEEFCGEYLIEITKTEGRWDFNYTYAINVVDYFSNN